MINKPNHLGEFDLLIIRGLRDIPQVTFDAMNMPYTASILASNSFDDKIQVYVTSDTQAGIDAYLEAFPESEIMEDSTFEEPDKWRVLGFPMENGGDKVLDIYYKGQTKELQNNS